MKYVVPFVIYFGLASTTSAGDIELAGMKSKTPTGWKQEEPTSKLRVGQFRIPKAEGDRDDAELALFQFPKGASGSADANLQRQVAKFKPAAGKDKVESKVEKVKVGSVEATYQDVTGVFLSKFPPFAPDAKITEKPAYRQLYVLFSTESGDYYLTLLGPAKTVEKNKKDFEEMLKNFK